MDRLDYYGCLEVNRDASQEEIKRAYRRMVRHSHPDVNPEDSGASNRLQHVIAAYRILGDPFSRARYDRVDDLFGPRKVSRDEVTQRQSTFWEERLYRQHPRPRTVRHRRSEARRPFIVGLLIFCLALMLVLYTIESDWFTTNPFHRAPRWRMPVETLRASASETPTQAIGAAQDWGIQYWACEYKMNQQSAFARTELARSFVRFAASEFSRGNMEIALDSAKMAARISPDLAEAREILQAVELSRRPALVNAEQERDDGEERSSEASAAT